MRDKGNRSFNKVQVECAKRPVFKMLHFTVFLIRNINSIEIILKNILQTQGYFNNHTRPFLLQEGPRKQRGKKNTVLTNLST